MIGIFKRELAKRLARDEKILLLRPQLAILLFLKYLLPINKSKDFFLKYFIFLGSSPGECEKSASSSMKISTLLSFSNFLNPKSTADPLPNFFFLWM